MKRGTAEPWRGHCDCVICSESARQMPQNSPVLANARWHSAWTSGLQVYAEVSPMRGMHMKSLWGGVAASALLFTVGCGATQNTRRRSRAGSGRRASRRDRPVVVSCEPHQRTLVRPVVVNGATVSQVECVAADPQAARHDAAPRLTRSRAGRAQPRRSATPPRVPRRSSTTTPRGRTRRPHRVAPAASDPDAPGGLPGAGRRKSRSVKKSAAIIGSSAAVGAGIGALAKGKKGALIGAAIGGGGAAVWDQITRREVG